MIHPADLPETVSVFPLPGALLLPRSRLPLHIFEPRYLQMLDDALKTRERLIGMVQPNTCQGDETKLHRIGCAGRVTRFSETEDDRYLITLTGISRFRVMAEVDGFTPYRRVSVSWDGFGRDLGKAEVDNGFDRNRFLKLIKRFFSSRRLSTDWDAMKDADDELLVNSLSMMLELEPGDKQALLEAPCLRTRRETLVTLIEFAMHGGANEEKPQ